MTFFKKKMIIISFCRKKMYRIFYFISNYASWIHIARILVRAYERTYLCNVQYRTTKLFCMNAVLFFFRFLIPVSIRELRTYVRMYVHIVKKKVRIG